MPNDPAYGQIGVRVLVSRGLAGDDGRVTQGEWAPEQVGFAQSGPTTCGAACLVMARMLTDGQLRDWVTQGRPGDERTPQERFAWLERRTHRRTTALFGVPGHIQPPWPRFWGTPPWGARAELDWRTAAQGVAYRWVTVRWQPPIERGSTFDAALGTVTAEAPALLYVGDEVCPRHVCLVHADPAGGGPLVYEPGQGTDRPLLRSAFVDGRLDLGGWHRAWFVISPGLRAVGGTARRPLLAPQPLRSPGAATVLLRERS